VTEGNFYLFQTPQQEEPSLVNGLRLLVQYSTLQ